MSSYGIDIYENDDGYGFYCDLEPCDNVQIPLPQKLQHIPPELYPAEYYYDDVYDYKQINDPYKHIAKQFKTTAYNIFSEFSFACVCAAATFCIMKYYK